MNIQYNFQIIFCLGLSFILGCGHKSSPGVRVTGTVTAENLPLVEGLITYIPIAGTTGQKCSVVIRDGVYTIDPSQGLAEGKYRVEVMGLPPGIKAMAEGTPYSHSPSTYREIDPAFNERSTLQCTLQSNVENKADFSVKYVP